MATVTNHPASLKQQTRPGSFLRPEGVDSDWFLEGIPDSVVGCFKPCFSQNLTNPRILGYVISGPISEAEISEAARKLEEANRPCGQEFALQAVTALRLRTSAKPEHINDIAAMAALYAGDMADYPEDVVLRACQSLARSSKWFPSWSELYELLELISSKRRHMFEAAKAYGCRHG